MISDLHFLVVDDMEAMRRILTNSLRQIGVKDVTVAVNGAEAWRLIQSQPFDAVITDWHMPVMSGLELVQKIRANALYTDLPTLMLTSVTEPHQVKLAIDAGVSEYLIKPFSVGSLEAKIRKVLKQPLPVIPTVGAHIPALLKSSSLMPTTQAANPGQETILVVDDVPDNIRMLVGLLSTSYTVKAALNGEQALKILASDELPDLILLDVSMPKMDGYEVCRRIKANPATADIPVIFLTSMDKATDVSQGFAVGAVDFITKPADPPILRARIATHLKLRRSFAELRRNRLALIDQNAILQDNLRLRDEFERIGQHDLKSPLTGMISFTADLLADATLSAEHKEMVGYIAQSAYSVLNMVNLSLDLYKMEQDSYTLNPSTANLAQLLQRAVKEIESAMAAKSVRAVLRLNDMPLDERASVPVQCDEFLCQAMFAKLLHNAVESSGSGRSIEIDITPAPDQVEVSLRNDGVVPRDVRASFFDKFTTSGKPEGTGLGTYIARLIAQTHRGDITMQTSDEQHTTTLSVRLPCTIEGA